MEIKWRINARGICISWYFWIYKYLYIFEILDSFSHREERETNQINKFKVEADAGKRMAKCQMWNGAIKAR